LYGLEAINANNGWAISVVGVTIVFSGLVGLSFVISQLHKVLAFWEDPSKIKALFKAKQSEELPEDENTTPASDQMSSPEGFTESQKETAKQFFLLARTMEDHFSLSNLLHLAGVSGLKDPCSNLNNLLNLKIILPDGSGFFTWDKDRFDKLVS